MNRRQMLIAALGVIVAAAIIDQTLNGVGVYRGWAHFVQPGRAWELGGRGFSDNTPHTSREGTLNGALGAGQTFSASIPMGSLELDGSPSATGADLSYKVTAYADTEALAKSYVDQVTVELVSVEGDGAAGLQLRVNQPPLPAGVRGLKLNVSGTLPTQAKVDVRNAYGLVRVAGLSGPSRVNNRWSQTTVRDVTGDWTVSAAYSQAFVDGVKGSLVLDGDYGSSDISNVSGNVDVDSDYRATTVNQVGGSLTANLRYGGIEVDGVQGDTKIESAYGNVMGSDAAGNVQVTSRYGNIRWRGLRRNVDIRSRYADVSLAFVQPLDHRFEVRTRYANIEDGIGLTSVPTADRHEKAVAGKVGQGRYQVKVDGEYAGVTLHDGPTVRL